MMMTAVGRLFDQYSVICVFGSVVGCVVVPLITQSMETLIFSAIVMTLTAKTLGQRILALRQDTPTRDDAARRSKDKDPTHEKKAKRKKIVQVQPVLSTDLQHRRLEDIKKQEEMRQTEKERRVEEKKEKRARKKEERSKRKEEEKREKEREELLRRERQEQRAQKKQERERKTSSVHFPIIESLSQIESLSYQRPIQHERKHSSSSSTTSTSSTRSHSYPHRNRHSHRQPVRASSDPLLPSPPSPTYHNSHPSLAQTPPPTRAWMTSSLPQAPLNWQLTPNDSNLQPIQRVNSDPSCHLQPQHQLLGSGMQYPNPTWFAQAPPLGALWPQGPALVHPELVESSQQQQVAWVPATMATTPLDMLRYASMNSVLSAINGGDACGLYAGDFPQVGNEGYYSLFSNNGQSPFGTALLPSSTGNTDPDPSPSSNADLEPEPEPDLDSMEPVKPESPSRECDDWPSL